MELRAERWLRTWAWIGLLHVPACAEVGKTGKVLAVDIQDEMIETSDGAPKRWELRTWRR